MPYSYSAPVAYGPQVEQTQYNNVSSRKSSLPFLVGGAVAGSIGGGVIGGIVNPFISSKGTVKDEFAKNAYKKYAKTAAEPEKKFYEQSINVLKKIGKIKTVDELKTLASENTEVFNEVKKKLSLDGIKEENLCENIKTIKENVTTGLNSLYQSMKNNIQNCWNKDKKVFEKTSGISEEIFNSIQEAKKGAKLKNVGKYALIGALSAGALAFIADKVLANQKNISKQ